MGETVLVVGNGGREHAFMEAMDKPGLELLSTRGNVGMQQLGESVDVAPTDITGVVRTAVERNVGMVVVGPESPLIAGLAEELRLSGVPTVGFDRDAARLEGSKVFGWGFAKRHGLLVPEGYVAHSISEAKDYASSHDPRSFVTKADGEAGGKGVALPESLAEAMQEIRELMVDGKYNNAGKERILFQERLHGPEASLFAIFDGRRAYVFELAQDHKRLQDGDEGPNTGGMGAYSPVPEAIVSQDQRQKMYEALEKTIDGTIADGINTPGIFYMGFMLAEEYGGDPALMEYNVRFGDPEAQVVLTLLKKAGQDVHGLFDEAAHGGFIGDKIQFLHGMGQAALTVCLAAPGYPTSPQTGKLIYGLDREYKDVTIHHGGTKRSELVPSDVVTSGGRVLYLTGVGETIDEAAKHAYAAIGESGVSFSDMQYRTDIGAQALQRA